uniref:Uncharacterized protein n=1 Tax=Arion vulgaris TaxID=1028688 RepID=A0A0B7ADV4_9EUPU
MTSSKCFPLALNADVCLAVADIHKHGLLNSNFSLLNFYVEHISSLTFCREQNILC